MCISRLNKWTSKHCDPGGKVQILKLRFPICLSPSSYMVKRSIWRGRWVGARLGYFECMSGVYSDFWRYCLLRTAPFRAVMQVFGGESFDLGDFRSQSILSRLFFVYCEQPDSFRKRHEKMMTRDSREYDQWSLLLSIIQKVVWALSEIFQAPAACLP